MRTKVKLPINSIILFCELWVYFSLNSSYIDFSLYTILRWVFPALLILSAMLAKRGRIAAPPRLVPWFTIAVLPSCFLGADPGTSLAKYVSWVLIFYGSYIFFRQCTTTSVMHQSLNLLSKILIIFQILNFAFVITGMGTDGDRAYGITTNPNTLGVYSNLAFWSGVYWIENKKRSAEKFIWTCFTVSTAYTAIACGSRTAFVIIVINVLILLFLRKPKLKTLVLLVMGLAISGYLVLSGKLDFLNIDAIRRLSEDGGTERGTLWDLAMSVWSNNKLFGVGYTLSSRFNQMDYGLAFHNSYISLLVECGLWGVIVFAAAVVPIVMKLISYFLNCDPFGNNREFGFACLMLMVLAITAWGESFMFAVGSTEGFVFWFLLAWVMCYVDKSKKEQGMSLSSYNKE